MRYPVENFGISFVYQSELSLMKHMTRLHQLHSTESIATLPYKTMPKEPLARVRDNTQLKIEQIELPAPRSILYV